MNKQTQQIIENRIFDLEHKPYVPSDERIEEIKQCAFEEYEHYLKEKKEKWRIRNRQLLRFASVFTMAFIFLFSSAMYSVLAPVSIANANNFVRKVAIWFNNQFHLGYTFSTPVDDTEAVLFDEDQFLTSIEELQSSAKMPIVYLPENNDLYMEGIELTTKETNWQMVRIRYISNNGDFLTILLEAAYDYNTIGVNLLSAKEIETQIGNIYLWSDDTFSYAFGIKDGIVYNITSSFAEDYLEKLCRTLTN